MIYTLEAIKAEMIADQKINNINALIALAAWAADVAARVIAQPDKTG
ncbi:MAG: hypothetical protein GDA36_05460 [Rhodobacteraceae bacterium]|nr:hypothetical protein [Paracoccaceae bacterium]